jgi:amidase
MDRTCWCSAANFQICCGTLNTEYLNTRIEDLYYSQTDGIDHALDTNKLDAILFPAYAGSFISAKAGYPTIALPAGYLENGRPFGITLAGTEFSEGTLIKLAYSFEQATAHRRSPIYK